LNKIHWNLSRNFSLTDKMSKLFGWMSWPGFEVRYLHLCVWIYNDFVISSIYKKIKNTLKFYVIWMLNELLSVEYWIKFCVIWLLNVKFYVTWTCCVWIFLSMSVLWQCIVLSIAPSVCVLHSVFKPVRFVCPNSKIVFQVSNDRDSFFTQNISKSILR